MSRFVLLIKHLSIHYLLELFGSSQHVQTRHEVCNRGVESTLCGHFLVRSVLDVAAKLHGS